MITKHEFITAKGNLTSIVMDSDEFMTLCDEISLKTKLSVDQVKTLRSNGHIPLIQRGSTTRFIFDKYDVNTSMLSVIIRGNGTLVFAKMMSQGQA